MVQYYRYIVGEFRDLLAWDEFDSEVCKVDSIDDIFSIPEPEHIIYLTERGHEKYRFKLEVYKKTIGLKIKVFDENDLGEVIYRDENMIKAKKKC